MNKNIPNPQNSGRDSYYIAIAPRFFVSAEI